MVLGLRFETRGVAALLTMRVKTSSEEHREARRLEG
jgi:hypothetical protein